LDAVISDSFVKKLERIQNEHSILLLNDCTLIFSNAHRSNN
jgi:hypothetical protein